jgi:hypothetical protein
MTPKFKVNDIITIGNQSVVIGKIDAFGSQPHYAFYSYDGDFHNGWLSCKIVDQIAELRKEAQS